MEVIRVLLVENDPGTQVLMQAFFARRKARGRGAFGVR